MGKPAHLRWGLIPLSVALTVVALHKTHPVQADQAPPPTEKTLKLGEAKPGTLYAMTVAIKDPAKLQGADAVLATVKDSPGGHRLQMAAHRRPRLLPHAPPKSRRTRNRNPFLRQAGPRNHNILKEDPPATAQTPQE